MKRVYVVFESSSDSVSDIHDWYWATHNYEDYFIEVYDNYPTAIQSIREWALQQENVVNRRSEKSSEEVLLNVKDSPYSNDETMWLKREVKSTLLKSS